MAGEIPCSLFAFGARLEGGTAVDSAELRLEVIALAEVLEEFPMMLLVEGTDEEGDAVAGMFFGHLLPLSVPGPVHGLVNHIAHRCDTVTGKRPRRKAIAERL